MLAKLVYPFLQFILQNHSNLFYMDNIENAKKNCLESLAVVEVLIAELENQIKLTFQQAHLDANTLEPMTQLKQHFIEALLIIQSNPNTKLPSQYQQNNNLKDIFYLYKELDEVLNKVTHIQEKIARVHHSLGNDAYSIALGMMKGDK